MNRMFMELLLLREPQYPWSDTALKAENETAFATSMNFPRLPYEIYKTPYDPVKRAR